MNKRKPLFWLSGEVKTPPFSEQARHEAGMLLGRLQDGAELAMPHARPMPSISEGCLELRIKSKEGEWRILCRIFTDAIVILDVFKKKTEKTPKSVIATCIRRLSAYERIVKGN